MTVIDSPWHLRPVLNNDAGALYEIFNIAEVYRYLADGAAPPVEIIDEWLHRGLADFKAVELGIFMLESPWGDFAGCVDLKWEQELRSAELTYLLDPQYWGEGLATRMCWSLIEKAFAGGHVDQITAGADQPNKKSIAVMQRLGMTFLRNLEYPMGSGVEYCLKLADAPPNPLPDTFPFYD